MPCGNNPGHFQCYYISWLNLPIPNRPANGWKREDICQGSTWKDMLAHSLLLLLNFLFAENDDQTPLNREGSEDSFHQYNTASLANVLNIRKYNLP